MTEASTAGRGKEMEIEMSFAMDVSAAIDQARELLCRVIARVVNTGSYTVRLRIVQKSGEPAEVWFYAHRNDGWQKEPDNVTDPVLARAMHETVDMLYSRGHGDDWSLRQHVSSDYRDTDIKFHREKLQDRLGEKLDDRLTGLLFRDTHDSKQDSRRAIRNRR